MSEPWELALEEWLETNPKIIETRPATPKPRFVAEHGVLRSNHGMSKRAIRDYSASMKKQIRAHEQDVNDWQALRDSGEIPDITTSRDSNPDLESDKATLRTMHKRSVYRAVAKGLDVPLAVLREYGMDKTQESSP